MAKGRFVNSSVFDNCSLRLSTGRAPAPRLPSAPAFETAATSSAEVNGPIPAWMMGYRMPRRSQIGVRNILYLTLDGILQDCGNQVWVGKHRKMAGFQVDHR